MPKLALYDLDDVERLAGAIVRQSGLELSHHDREDAVAYLVETAWELSLDYQPGIIALGFRKFCATALQFRLIDWQRKTYGRRTWKFKDRVYERPKREFISLDGPGRDRLEQALAEGGGDSEADRLEAERWLHNERDRYRAADLELLGLEAD